MRGRRKLWLYGGIAGLLILIITGAWLAASSGRESRGAEPEAQQETEAAIQPTLGAGTTDLWNRAQLWNRASGEFLSDNSEPVLLWKTGESLLYIQNNELLLASKDSESPKGLLEFQQDQKLRLWTGDMGLLVGGTPEAGAAEEDTAAYSYYYVRFPIEEKKEITVTLKRSNIPPADVMKVEAADWPEFLILHTFKSGKRQSNLLNPQANTEREISYRSEPDLPEQTPGPPLAVPGVISALKSHPSIRGSLHSYSTNDGTLLYDNYDNATLYMGLRYDSYVSFPMENDESARKSAFVLQSDNGLKYMAFSSSGLDPWTPSLLSPGWKARDSSSLLYRLTDSRMEAISYSYSNKSSHSLLHESVLPVERLTLQNRYGTRFDFVNNEDQSKVHISLLDLSNSYDSNPQVADFQIHDSLKGTPESMAMLKRHSSSEERQLPYSKRNSNQWPSQIPADLKKELEDLYGQGSGDGSSSTAFYEELGTWYVLQYDRLSRFVPGNKPLERLELVTELPVRFSCSVSNVSRCRTAEGILRADGSWFIADTYNDRILRLDDKFVITGVAYVSLPSSISLTDSNKLLVESFTGIHTYDLELKLEKKREEGFAKVPAGSKTKTTLPPSSYYEDTSSGLLWYYESGYLHQYRKQDNTVRSYYVSHLENATGSFRILPYKDRIIAFSDHRLLQFSRKDGSYLRASKFDRADPDGIYDTTSFGENSYVLDREKGRLYLVQGYRILSIDLDSWNVQELFRQSDSDIGELVLYQDMLLFTQQPGGIWGLEGNEDPGRVNQLVRLELSTLGTTRYAIPNSYYSGSIDGKDMILRLFPPYESESTAGYRIPLNSMK
jgi:hypothetical protein